MDKSRYSPKQLCGLAAQFEEYINIVTEFRSTP